MIIQACLNGARRKEFHPLLPLTKEAIARDAATSVAAGAAELHIHPRNADGQESLLAVDETIALVRNACPGTLVGVSTGAWIEGNVQRTRAAIQQWREPFLPDYASVNLAENDAPAVMELLLQRGIGIEAGLASIGDAVRYARMPERHRAFRVLIELDFEKEFAAARQIADDILRILQNAGVSRPILLHGFDTTVWAFVELARRHGFSTRVGLEDGKHLSDGTTARDNSELVVKAVEIFRR